MSYRFLSPTERLQSTLSDRDREWFVERDENGDGQIAMSEYSNAWTAEKVEEFAALDGNADGLITAQEYAAARNDSSAAKR